MALRSLTEWVPQSYYYTLAEVRPHLRPAGRLAERHLARDVLSLERGTPNHVPCGRRVAFAQPMRFSG